MSGRGKGGKGLGKGGAKRHRKVLNWRLIKAYMDLAGPVKNTFQTLYHPSPNPS